MRIFLVPLVLSMAMPPHLLAQTLMSAPGIPRKLFVNGISVELSPGRKLYKPGPNPKDSRDNSLKVSQLIKSGQKNAAKNLCLDIAVEEEKIPFEEKKGLAKPEKPEIAKKMSPKNGEEPPLLKRDPCGDNFERDRCVGLLSRSLEEENQALYGSKLIGKNGYVDPVVLTKVAKILDLKKEEGFEIDPLRNIEISELTDSLESTKSGAVGEIISGFFVDGEESKKTFKTELHKALDSESDDEVAEILGQPSIIILTGIIVQKIDEALAKNEFEKSEAYLKLLEEVNPSAAKGLSCLLDLSKSSLDSSKENFLDNSTDIGPISGYDYSQQLDNLVGDGGVSLVIAGGMLIATAVFGSIAWYYSEKNLDLAEKNQELAERAAAENTAIFVKETGWHAPKIYPGTLSTYKPDQPKDQPPVDRNPVSEDKKNGGPDYRDMWDPMAPGIGGKGGELMDPESVAAALLWGDVLKERDRIAEIAKIINYDESQISTFCDEVVADKQYENMRKIANSERKIEAIDIEQLKKSLSKSGSAVIAFDSWKTSDGFYSRSESLKDIPESCFVSDPVRRVN